MIKLVIDFKDTWLAVTTLVDSRFVCRKVETGPLDFTAVSGSLDRYLDTETDALFKKSGPLLIALPQRMSVCRIVSLDNLAIERYGTAFVDWVAEQQIPEELGNFVSGFVNLGKSYDGKKSQNLFFGVPAEIYDSIKKFVAPDNDKELLVYPETIGLFKLLWRSTDKNGLAAAVSLEQQGAVVVVTMDMNLIAATYLKFERQDFGDELMCYIMGHLLENDRPSLLLAGDLSLSNRLGTLDWADQLSVPEELKSVPPDFYAAAGLCLWGE